MGHWSLVIRFILASILLHWTSTDGTEAHSLFFSSAEGAYSSGYKGYGGRQQEVHIMKRAPLIMDPHAKAANNRYIVKERGRLIDDVLIKHNQSTITADPPRTATSIRTRQQVTMLMTTHPRQTDAGSPVKAAFVRVFTKPPRIAASTTQNPQDEVGALILDALKRAGELSKSGNNTKLEFSLPASKTSNNNTQKDVIVESDDPSLPPSSQWHSWSPTGGIQMKPSFYSFTIREQKNNASTDGKRRYVLDLGIKAAAEMTHPDDEPRAVFSTHQNTTTSSTNRTPFFEELTEITNAEVERSSTTTTTTNDSTNKPSSKSNQSINAVSRIPGWPSVDDEQNVKRTITSKSNNMIHLEKKKQASSSAAKTKKKENGKKAMNKKGKTTPGKQQKKLSRAVASPDETMMRRLFNLAERPMVIWRKSSNDRYRRGRSKQRRAKSKKNKLRTKKTVDSKSKSAEFMSFASDEPRHPRGSNYRNPARVFKRGTDGGSH